MSISAVVAGTSYNLTWDGSAGAWRTSNIAVAPGAGPLSVKLAWEQTDNTVTGCVSFTFDVIVNRVLPPNFLETFPEGVAAHGASIRGVEFRVPGSEPSLSRA